MIKLLIRLYRLVRKYIQNFGDDLLVCSTFLADFFDNYAIYGDKVSHFHVHVVPKREGELQWGGPFTDDIEKVKLPEEVFLETGRDILDRLDRICREKGLSLVRRM